jgi:RNA polymerase sigma factor for flagellar operon FliA
MMDNPRPERPHPILMPSIDGRARQSDDASGLHTTRTRRAPAVTAEARFLAALPVIDDVTGYVCRRHHLSAAEADEFRSDVRMHFIDNNYEVLNQFEGRCALPTFVNVVVQRVFFDWRNRTWGRWRPSAEARRRGPAASRLECLVHRDGWTVDEALETLRVNHGVAIDHELRAFSETLGARPGRRLVPQDEAGEVEDTGPGADTNVLQAEHGFLAKRVHAALDRARLKLPPDEQLILKMRFYDRMPVSDIARALNLNQRPLYRTIEQMLSVIKKAMAAEGVSEADVAELLDAGSWQDTGDRTPVPFNSAPERVKGAAWLRRR